MTTNGLKIKDHNSFIENLKKLKSGGFNDQVIFNIALFLCYFPLKEKRWKVFGKLNKRGKYAIIMNHLHGMAIKQKINSYILNRTTTDGLSYYKNRVKQLEAKLNEFLEEESVELDDRVKLMSPLKDIETNLLLYKNLNNRRYKENLQNTNFLCILLIEQKEKENGKQ